MIANETLDAYIIAKDSADRRLHGFHNLGRHFILDGTTEVWFTVSDDYEVGHTAMVSQLERLRVKSALTATPALLPGKPDGWIWEDEFTCEVEVYATWLEAGKKPTAFYFSPQATQATRPKVDGLHSDDLAVDRFVIAMKTKLFKKREQGFGGWDNPDECSIEHLSRLLINHVAKGDPVDVANLAMMIHQRGGTIAAPTLPPGEPSLYGPYGYLNGCRALTEDTWELENDPIENNDEYFSIPLFAKVDVSFPVTEPSSSSNCTTVAEKEIPGELEYFEGKLTPVVNAARTGWWRFHKHYDRDGYCDNPGRGY